jgi:hypothetical protein
MVLYFSIGLPGLSGAHGLPGFKGQSGQSGMYSDSIDKQSLLMFYI